MASRARGCSLLLLLAVIGLCVLSHGPAVHAKSSARARLAHLKGRLLHPSSEDDRSSNAGDRLVESLLNQITSNAVQRLGHDDDDDAGAADTHLEDSDNNDDDIGNGNGNAGGDSDKEENLEAREAKVKQELKEIKAEEEVLDVNSEDDFPHSVGHGTGWKANDMFGNEDDGKNNFDIYEGLPSPGGRRRSANANANADDDDDDDDDDNNNNDNDDDDDDDDDDEGNNAADDILAARDRRNANSDNSDNSDNSNSNSNANVDFEGSIRGSLKIKNIRHHRKNNNNDDGDDGDDDDDDDDGERSNGDDEDKDSDDSGQGSSNSGGGNDDDDDDDSGSSDEVGSHFHRAPTEAEIMKYAVPGFDHFLAQIRKLLIATHDDFTPPDVAGHAYGTKHEILWLCHVQAEDMWPYFFCDVLVDVYMFRYDTHDILDAEMRPKVAKAVAQRLLQDFGNLDEALELEHRLLSKVKDEVPAGPAGDLYTSPTLVAQVLKDKCSTFSQIKESSCIGIVNAYNRGFSGEMIFGDKDIGVQFASTVVDILLLQDAVMEVRQDIKCYTMKCFHKLHREHPDDVHSVIDSVGSTEVAECLHDECTDLREYQDFPKDICHSISGLYKNEYRGVDIFSVQTIDHWVNELFFMLRRKEDTESDHAPGNYAWIDFCYQPTPAPTPAPTTSPTGAPSVAPTTGPTAAPSTAPTTGPTTAPSAAPTSSPSVAPTIAPTTAPSSAPTTAPTTTPAPVVVTAAPTEPPTNAPTPAPTIDPNPCRRNMFNLLRQKLQGDPEICATSYIDKDNNCSGEVTYDKAVEMCSFWGDGVRLCTKSELQADEATATGCHYDWNKVWTMSDDGCPEGQFITRAGSSAPKANTDFPETCSEKSTLAYVRCCAHSGETGDDAIDVTPPKTCAELEWDTKAGVDDKVCGSSRILAGDKCLDKQVNQAEAQAICKQTGGRLCTKEELENNETEGTGCNLEDKKIWSGSDIGCGEEQAYVVGGSSSAGITSFCGGTDEKYDVRCCADAELPPTPPPTPKPAINSDESLWAHYGKPKTCARLGWDVGGGSPDVCANSLVQAPGDCTFLIPYSVARDACAAVNSRICTSEELKNDEAVGSGCPEEDTMQVWTGTTEGCEEGMAIAQGGASAGLAAFPPTCVNKNKRFKVRCCSDAVLEEETGGAIGGSSGTTGQSDEPGPSVTPTAPPAITGSAGSTAEEETKKEEAEADAAAEDLKLIKF